MSLRSISQKGRKTAHALASAARSALMHLFFGTAMTRLSTSVCIALVLSAFLALPQAVHAQRISPTAFTPASVTTTPAAIHKVDSKNPLFGPGSRSRHVAIGVVIGAVAGGVYGAIEDGRDHSGEGFIAPVMVAAGAVAGSLVGALVGALWPTR